MFLDYWMLTILAIVWISSYIHMWKKAKICGIALGLNYVLDSMNYTEEQKKEYIIKCLKE